MKPYEGCAVCAVNELQDIKSSKECALCVFTLASKEDLISRLSDNINYTSYEHSWIREALLDAYNFTKERCAICKWYHNATFSRSDECDCSKECKYEIASKRDLIIRMIDDNYSKADHNLIKKALLDVYDFDYAKRYEGKTTKELLDQAIAEAGEKNNTSHKDTVDMKCDGGNCYKCLFWKPSYLNICENQFFTLASEKELIRRLDANEYENRRDDIIKTLKEQYGYDYETKSIIDLDSGIRFKNQDDMISAVKYWWRVANTDYLKQFETNDNGDDKMLYDDYMDSKMLNWTNDGDDTQMKLDDMINMDNSKRISKVEYYLGIADAVSKRGTCLRRNYGSVIVKDDHIVSTGYNGAPRGRVNCCDLGKCYRQEHNIPQGERYECCRSVHSEMNAVINASSEEMKGATLYLVGHENDGSLTDANCCMMCKRVIINSGISQVVLRQSNGSFKTVDVSEWIEHDDSLNM